MTTQKWDYNKEQELIRKYLEDSLTQEEELLVASMYDNDQEFRDTLDGLESLSAEEFTASMKSVSDRIDAKLSSAATTGELKQVTINTAERDNVRRMFVQGQAFRRLAIAASVILVLALGGTWLISQYNSPVDKLVAANFEAKPYPDLIVRGSGDDLSQQEKLAISAYNTENYQVSIQYFQELHDQYPGIVKYGLFLGISHMGIKDPTSAVEVLEPLVPEAGKFTEDVQWYLALAYLKTKRLEEARELLTILSANTSSYYSQPSSEMLRKL